MTSDRPNVQNGSSTAAEATVPAKAGPGIGRTLLWIGLSAAVVSTAVTLGVLRAVSLNRVAKPADETAERIQALIDEANKLLKKIDESR